MSYPNISVVHNWSKRRNTDNRYPVYLRITIHRKTKYFTIPLPYKVSPQEWLGKDNKWVKDSSPFFFEINNIISKYLKKVNDLIKRFIYNDRQIDFSDIFNELNTKGDKTVFNEFVRDYIYSKPEEKLEINTWKKYLTFSKHLDTYKKEIRFSNLNKQFVSDFKKYLEDELSLSGATIKLYFDKFKKIVNYATKSGYVDKQISDELFDDIVLTP
jgi:hypothetical protein